MIGFSLGMNYSVALLVFAYADPGSGILFWQLLVAGFAGLMFYLRRLLRWRHGDRGDKKSEDTPTNGE